jgi:ribosomal protein L21E
LLTSERAEPCIDKVQIVTGAVQKGIAHPRFHGSPARRLLCVETQFIEDRVDRAAKALAVVIAESLRVWRAHRSS